MTRKNLFLIIAFLYLPHCYSQQDHSHPSTGEIPAWLHECKKTTGNQTFDEIEAKWHCLKTKFDNLIKLNADNSSDSAISIGFCSTESHEGLRQCADQFVTAAKPCLTDAGKSDIDIQRNATFQVFEYICANDGKRLNEITTVDFRKCMTESNSAEYNSCVQSIELKSFAEYRNKSVFLETTCSSVEKWRQCFTTIAKKCGKPEIYAGIFDAMKLPCKNKNAKSDAGTLFSVENVTFIPLVFFITSHLMASM